MRKGAGVMRTERLVRLAEILGRLGPLTHGQLLRAVRTFVPDLLDNERGDHRLLRRALDRLRRLGFLGERGRAGLTGPWFWLTETGEEYLLAEGLLPAPRGDVATPYFGHRRHSDLFVGIHLTCDLARHRTDLTPRITRYAWEERITWTVDGTTDVEPDALLWLDVEGIAGTFVWAIEADTGTEAIGSTWSAKVSRCSALHEAIQTGRFALPAGVRLDHVQVLVVTPSPIRAGNLARATAATLGDHGPLFLFTTPHEWTDTTFWNCVWRPAGLGHAPNAQRIGSLAGLCPEAVCP